MKLNEKLATIQTKFKSKKSRFNSFGKYYFRSAEDILEAMVEEGLLGRDAREEEYWPDPEVKKKQQELPLQESRKRIRVRILRG